MEIRYRGYYYDEESGLYYLNSRYYDPETGRFVNADNLIDGGAGLVGYNLFAYAANNPINNFDPSGNWIIKDTIKWMAKNVTKPVVKIVQSVLLKVNATYSNGINISGTPSISGTVYHSVTNAPNISNLEGLGCQIGGSAGVPVYGVSLAVGSDFCILPDTKLNETYFGVTENLGFGTPGGELHVEWGKTSTFEGTQFNVFDVTERVYIKIMEW